VQLRALVGERICDGHPRLGDQTAIFLVYFRMELAMLGDGPTWSRQRTHWMWYIFPQIGHPSTKRAAETLRCCREEK
jgi:uncharacterized protein (DUF1810 family)